MYPLSLLQESIYCLFSYYSLSVKSDTTYPTLMGLHRKASFFRGCHSGRSGKLGKRNVLGELRLPTPHAPSGVRTHPAVVKNKLECAYSSEPVVHCQPSPSRIGLLVQSSKIKQLQSRRASSFNLLEVGRDIFFSERREQGPYLCHIRFPDSVGFASKSE